MDSWLSPEFTGQLLLFLFGALFLFHLLVMLGVIPYHIIWGGRIKNRREMLRMETVSLLVLLMASIIVAERIQILRLGLPSLVIKIALWSFTAFFAVSILGNLLAKHPIEKYGFSLLVTVLTILLFLLAIA